MALPLQIVVNGSFERWQETGGKDSRHPEKPLQIIIALAPESLCLHKWFNRSSDLSFHSEMPSQTSMVQ